MPRNHVSRWDRHRDGMWDTTRDVMHQSQSQSQSQSPFLYLTGPLLTHLCPALTTDRRTRHHPKANWTHRGASMTDDLTTTWTELLAEHRYREVRGDYEVEPFYKHFGCSCGWEQNIAGMNGWRSWIAAHEAHVAAVLVASSALKAHTDEAVEAAVHDYIKNVQPAITNVAVYQYQQKVADLHLRTAHWRQPRPDICWTCQVAYPCPTVAAVRAAAAEPIDCSEFIETGDCNHSDADHDAMAEGETR